MTTAIVLTIAVQVVPAGPAGAVTDDERFTAYDAAAVDLTEEVGWLVRLGGLAAPVPRSIADIPDNIGLPVLSRAEMIEELRHVDTDGSRVMQMLVATGDAPSVAVRDTFRLLPPGTLEQLASGQNPGIGADGYRVAYDEILAVWYPLYEAGAQKVTTGSSSAPATTMAPAPADPQGVSTPTAPQQFSNGAPAPAPANVGPVATPAEGAPANPTFRSGPPSVISPANGSLPAAAASGGAAGASGTTGGSGATGSSGTTGATGATTTVVATTDPADVVVASDVADEGSSSGAPAIPIVIGAGALAVAASVWAVLRRRRRVPASPAAAAGADHDHEYEHGPGGVAVDELFELSRVLPTLRTPEAVAAHAVTVVAAMVGAGTSVAVVDHDLAPLAGRLELGASVLRPVLEAGSRVRKVVGDQAFVAAPLVTSGRVRGAVVASRTGPAFSAAVEHQLHQVATVMASSLQAAFDHRDAERLAYVDGLTQVANRRRFDLDLADALRAAHAGAAPVSLAMVDIDHFKRLNDEYGHQTGDEVLRQVATTIAANVRTDDVVYRYGGEEFAVLLPGADAAQAAEVVERVRAAVQSRTFVGERGDDLAVTVSVGVARSLADEPRDLLAAADSALYEAKDGGRNRVVVADR